MKKLLLSFITATLLSSMSAGSAGAQELPEQKETLATIIKVNDYFMKKYADYTLPSFFGRVRPSNIWTRGVYYEGLIALYSIYPREDYYSYTYDWANFHKWGMRNGNTTRNADDQCCGQVYIDLYNMCPSDPNMIRNIKASIDMVVNTPQVNDWWWIDAIQMAMPIYAKFGKMTGEQKYYNKMWDLYAYTRTYPWRSRYVQCQRRIVVARSGFRPSLQGAERQELLLVQRQRLGICSPCACIG